MQPIHQSIDHCAEMQCPVQFVLDLISGKWSILILRELFEGNRRTHELLDTLPGLSTKVLMQRLRELEKHGLIQRHAYAEVPPHVEYSLTPKGREIKPVLAALRELGLRWLEQEPCACPLEFNTVSNHAGDFHKNLNTERDGLFVPINGDDHAHGIDRNKFTA